MENRTRTEIRFETDRNFVITKHARGLRASCGLCAPPSKMVTTEEAVRATGLTSRAVHHALKTSKLHSIETRAGLVLFCLNSLSLLRNERSPVGIVASSSRLVPLHQLKGSTDVSQLIEDSNAGESLISLDAATDSDISKEHGLRVKHKERTAWALTSEIFEKLLDRLDGNRERAGETYEKIRCRMMKFFACRHCASPEDLADETIDRVARRIGEGKEIWTINPASYFYGVARNVLREYWDSVERENLPLEYLPILAEPCEQPATVIDEQTGWTVDMMLEALEHCLRALSPENRELILEYYQGEGRSRIQTRQSIAERLHLQPNALRIRVHRIREKLERNVRQFLQEN